MMVIGQSGGIVPQVGKRGKDARAVD